MGLARFRGRSRIQGRNVLLLCEDGSLEDVPSEVEFLCDAGVRGRCLLGLELAVDPEPRVASDEALDSVAGRAQLELELHRGSRPFRRALSTKVVDTGAVPELAEERPPDRLGDRRLAGAVRASDTGQPIRELELTLLEAAPLAHPQGDQPHPPASASASSAAASSR